MGCSLFTDLITDLFQREHTEILAGIGVEYKKWLSAYKAPISNISETGQDRTNVTIAD